MAVEPRDSLSIPSSVPDSPQFGICLLSHPLFAEAATPLQVPGHEEVPRLLHPRAGDVADHKGLRPMF
jgi:hypothetical protein